MEPGDKIPGKSSIEKRLHRLVEDHIPLVKSIARQILSLLPPEVEFSELVAAGQEGLLQAAQRFDPSRGNKFSTFAFYRIRGAIFDNLRKMSYLNRADYKHYRQNITFKANADAYLATRSEETTHTVSEEISALEDTVADITVIFVTSLDEITDKDPEKPIAHAPDPNPEDFVSRQDLHRFVKSAREALNKKEAEIVRLLYDEELDLTRAAEQMNISKAWASRLHTKAIQTLSNAMSNRLEGSA